MDAQLRQRLTSASASTDLEDVEATGASHPRPNASASSKQHHCDNCCPADRVAWLKRNSSAIISVVSVLLNVIIITFFISAA